MKPLFPLFALAALTTFAVAPTLIHAQDVPPPPPDQGAPPPQDQGEPPPSDQDLASQGDQGTSFQTFYDQLGDQGTWIQTDDYGYVFQPNVSDPDWAPYRDGHWAYTDQGWAWVSDEPWGWATYHYGRWANIDGTGWVWVPGYRWAPAWVSWRYGGGYAGWAPLPPETFVGAEYGNGGGFNVGVGFHFGSDVDVNFNIGPGCYNFVRVGDFGEPNYRGHYIDRSRNYTVINNTTNITNININKTVVNNYGAAGAGGNFRGVAVGGPSLAEVNAHSHQHIQTMHLTEANQPGRSSVQGNSLAVYAPRLNPASVHTARPTQVGQTLSHPTFNRGDSITKPLAVTSSIRPAAPSQEAIAAASAAQAHAPAKARIATEKTQVKTPLSQPLTSMEPVTPVHHTSSTTAPLDKNFTGEKSASPSPSVEHSTANAPSTGEAPKPVTTYHPQTEEKPAQSFHPQTEEKPAPTFHPQAEEKPAPTFHPSAEEKPAPVFHPQAQQNSAPAFHPQAQQNAAPAFHPQSAPNHEAAPVHPQAAASTAKPAPAEAKKKPADDKKTPPEHQ